MKQYRFHASLLAFLALIFALQAWLPGAIIPAIVPSAVPVPNKTASGTVRFLICDVNENCVIKGGYSTGSGSGATGSLALTGATSGSTVTVTVDTSTTSGTLKFPGVTGFLPAINGSITPGDCANWFSAVQLGDAGAACGSGGGTGAANPSCTFAGTATGCGTPTSIDVSAFNAATINQILVQCWTGAGTTQTPLTILTYVYTTGSGIVQTVAPTFSAAVAAGYCTANGNGSGGSGGDTVASPYITVSGTKYGPIFGPATPPGLVSAYTWVNQGSSTATSTNGSIFLSQPGHSGDSWGMLVNSLPSGGTVPYTITMGVLLQLPNIQASQATLILRDSGSGAICTYGWAYNSGVGGGTTPGFIGLRYNSPSSFNGSDFAFPQSSVMQTVWIRVQDDGTNRITSFSQDGINFVQYDSRARTSFITPDQYGFGVDAANGATLQSVSMTVLSLAVTTP